MTKEDKSPEIVAYRVGKLEEALDKGLEEVKQEIRIMNTNVVTMAANYITVERMTEVITEKNKEHEAMKKRISNLESFNSKVVSRIAYGAVVMFVLMVLALYGLDKFWR